MGKYYEFLTLSTMYAEQGLCYGRASVRTSVCPSVCPSHRSTAATVAGGFAAERRAAGSGAQQQMRAASC